MSTKEAKLQIVVDAQNRAGATFDTLGRNLDAVSKKTENMRQGMMAVGTAGAVAFGALSVGIGLAIKESSDINESVNAVRVVFKEAAEEILSFSKTAAQAVGLAQSEFNQLASVTGALLKQTGLPMDDVAERAINLTRRAADLASVFNTSVPDALFAMNAALRGETEPIRRYAGDVTDATLQTYLLSQGITDSVMAMSQAEKMVHRYNLIMQQSSDTANDFTNTSGELANKSRILTAEIKNLQGIIGDEFRPILLEVLKAVQPVITAVSAWIAENPELTKWIIIATFALTGLMAILLPLAVMLPGLVIMFGGLATAFGVVTAISAPLLLAIAGIATALILLAQQGYFTKEAWANVWLGIKIIAAESANAVIGIVEGMVNFIIDGVNQAIRLINKVISAAQKVPGIGKKFDTISELDKVDWKFDTNTIAASDLAGRGMLPVATPPQIVITGNTFLSEDVAQQIGDMMIGKLKLSNAF